MFATRRGIAAVRSPRPRAANDNVRGAITPDDRPFFAALALVCLGIVLLAAYVAFDVPDDVMAVLRR